MLRVIIDTRLNWTIYAKYLKTKIIKQIEALTKIAALT